MTCVVEVRGQLLDAARDLRGCDAVVAVDVLAPAQDTANRWTIEVVCETPHVPPAVLLELGHYDCSIRPGASGTQGGHAIVVASVC